jgi:hypothetical protein
MREYMRRRRAAGIDDSAYRDVRTPDGTRGEHRVVIERILGRKLAFNEVVHHIDGDRHNNDPRNLAVMDRGEHMRMHIAKRRAAGLPVGRPKRAARQQQQEAA